METFDLYSPTRVIFGKNVCRNVSKIIKEYDHHINQFGKKVMIHYGSDRIKKNGIFKEIIESLEFNDISYIEYGGVLPNPKLSHVSRGIDLCRANNVGLILAIGGGSVIDSAKAMAMGVFCEGELWDVYEERKSIFRALPVASILTIPAAGSESSPSTVITNEEKKLKYGYSSPFLRPLFCMIDPQMFFTLPDQQVANGVADMMSHVFERYFTKTKNNELTDSLCEATLRTIMNNAPLVLQDRNNYEAWCEIGFCGSFAHNGIIGMGRQEDWATHAMEHEVTALHDNVAHGAGLAILTPNWMRYVWREEPSIFQKFSEKIMGVNASGKVHESFVNEAIDKLSAFFKSMGLPTTLREIGVEKEELAIMAKKCVTRPSLNDSLAVGHFKELTQQDIAEIYEMSFD